MDVKRVAIIGLGLIGGSLGLALKQARGNELEITGFARRPETAEEAKARGAVDRSETQLTLVIEGADLIVIATPVMAMRDIFQQIADHLSPDAIVTDIGSTKVQIMQWAGEYLPPSVHFVGGHPMTGKETSGIQEAEAGLLQNCVYCLIPSPNAHPEALKEMQKLTQFVGAKSFLIDAALHDKLVAGISHLPILLSSALVSALARSPLWPKMSELAATGYRDITRLASGNPDMNRGICVTNQKAIVGWIDRYIEELREYRRLILNSDQEDHELEKSLEHAREIRQEWLENEGHRFI